MTTTTNTYDPRANAAPVSHVRRGTLARLKRGDYTVNEAAYEAASELKGLSQQRRDLAARLVIEALTLKGIRTSRDLCDGCHGALIGDELNYGTCGHCGGRSLHPSRSQ